MKKRLSAVLIFLMLLSVLQGLSMASLATGTFSENISFTATADKSILPATGGTVNITFTVTNNGVEAPENIKIYRQTNPTAVITTVDPSQLTVSISDFSIAASELDRAIKFQIEWEEAGIKYYNTYEGFIVYAFKADFTLEREISDTIVKKDDSITIKYTLTNTGTVVLSYPKIYDMGSTTTAVNASDPNLNNPIDPGESYVFTKTYTITQAQTSTPTVKCLYFNENNVSTEKSKTFDAIPIDLEDPGLTVVLTPGQSTLEYGKSTTLYCTVTNSGNVPIKNVTVYDDAGTMISNPQPSLEVGESVTRSRSVTPVQTKEYVFRITYTDPSNESLTVTTRTSAVKITVTGSPSTLLLTLKTDSEVAEIDEPGDVKMNVTVTNDNAYTVNNIEIKESNLGLSQTIDSLAPDEERVLEFTVPLQQTSNVLFEARVPNDNGDPYTFYANTVTITVNNPALTPTTSVGPTPSPSPSSTTDITGSGNTDWIKVLLIILGVILALIVLVTAALIVVNIMQKKQASKEVVVRRKIKEKDDSKNEAAEDIDE